jgi:hypothetical protein
LEVGNWQLEEKQEICAFSMVKLVILEQEGILTSNYWLLASFFTFFPSKTP